MEEANFVERSTHVTQAIKYLLENRSIINDLTLKEYLNWGNG